MAEALDRGEESRFDTHTLRTDIEVAELVWRLGAELNAGSRS